MTLLRWEWYHDNFTISREKHLAFCRYFGYFQRMDMDAVRTNRRGGPPWPARRQVVVRLSPELGETLERMAQEERRPLGAMARILIEDGLEARRQKGAA